MKIIFWLYRMLLLGIVTFCEFIFFKRFMANTENEEDDFDSSARENTTDDGNPPWDIPDSDFEVLKSPSQIPKPGFETDE